MLILWGLKQENGSNKYGGGNHTFVVKYGDDGSMEDDESLVVWRIYECTKVEKKMN